MDTIMTLTMNPAVDKSTTVDHVVPEDKLRCERPTYEPGGGGVNVSRAIKKLGGESRCFYLSGGPMGTMYESLLEEEGLDHHPVPVKDFTRENLMVFEQNSGQQFRFIMPGPKLSKQEWQNCLNRLRSLSPFPDYLVVSGSLPPGVPEDFYGRVARIAKDKGGRPVVDTSGKALTKAAREGLFLLKPNMRELSQLAGREIKHDQELEEVCRELIQNECCQYVVVSLGAGGAVFVTPDQIKRMRAPTVPIKSKVGAGDSMVAGMVLHLARGNPMEDAVIFGVAAGSAAVMTPGTELCDRENTERLYREIASRAA